MPQKYENAVSFLRLGLLSTLIHHKNGAFRKCSTNRRNMKTPPLCFSVIGKCFKNGTFRKRWPQNNQCDFDSLTEIYSNPIWPVMVRFHIPLVHFRNAKHLMRFRSEISIFQFQFSFLHMHIHDVADVRRIQKCVR